MPRNLPYNRADRVANQVFQVVSSYMYQDVDDERLVGVQITRAQMTKDLSIVRVYFYIEGGEDKKEAAKKALAKITPELRHLIGQEIVLKTLPKLEFYLDEGVENAERIEEILSQINK